MAKKIYLSTFSLKVLDRNTPTLLKTFNGKDDFFDLFKDFADDIHQNIKKTKSYKDKTTLHITLDKPVSDNKTDRVFYGYVSSGVGGDSFKVRNAGETATKFESDPDTDITYRNLFFYLQLPLNAPFGYLILQRKRDFAAKGSFQKAMNLYLFEKGYKGFFVGIYNLLNDKVFDKMITNGNLKNIDFIKKSIPKTIEELYEKGPTEEKGVLTTSIRSGSSLSTYWKDFVKGLYNQDNKNRVVEIQNGLDSLDEVEFELELNGKIKTFHIISKNRTWPDVEVSEDLTFNNKNEPTESSLVEVCENLIKDMLTLEPNVSQN